MTIPETKATEARHQGAKRLGRRWSAVALVICAVPLATAIRAPAAQGSLERTLKVNGPVELDVKTGAGRIEVRTGDESTVHVRGVIRATSGWGLSGEEKVSRLEADPPIEQDGNVIRIGRIRDKALSRNVSISYELIVPTATSLRADTGSGEQSIRGLSGPVDADTGSGNIAISNIGDDVKADTGSGDIRVISIRGAVHAGTGSGSIRGSDLAKGLWADTGSGTVEVHGLQGGLRADTGSGNILAEGMPTSEWRLDAGSGNIEVHLPARAGFTLYAHADSGRVTVDRQITVQGVQGRNEVRGKAGGGGPLLDLRSGSGDIHIE